MVLFRHMADVGPTVMDQALTLEDDAAPRAGQQGCKLTGANKGKDWVSARTQGSRFRRAKRSNDILSGVNTNTRHGRRIADLIFAYCEALRPSCDDLDLQARIRAAAELVVMAEEMRSSALGNVIVRADDVMRMQRLADAAVAKLGLHPQLSHARHRVVKPKIGGPSLAAYLNGGAE
jgi:hypothetical protein